MEHNIKEITKTGRKMGMANFYGLMVPLIKVNSWTIIFTVKASTHGLIRGNTMEIGRITRCMVKALSHGLMVECTKVSTMMIRNKDTECSHGLMGGDMKASG